MIAIVFDKSGTLVDTKRVSKDMESSEFIYHKSCLELIENNPNLYLVTISTDPRETFLLEDPKKNLGNSIKDFNIGFEVVFRGIDAIIDKNKILKWAERISIEEVNETLKKLKKEFDVCTLVGCGMVVDSKKEKITHIVASSGKIKEGVFELFDFLQLEGMDIYLATGDNPCSVYPLAKRLGIMDSFVFSQVDPEGKRKIISNLKKNYEQVIMVGDDINDKGAFEEADLSFLILEGEAERKNELKTIVNYIVSEPLELKEILRRFKI
ncbi:MAG: Soluble P-type ATPase-like phosphatase [Candidatus Methanofastidiosum methylothiophilum]|jgi:Cu+-exporting ATPase|uniref:Soluble P-type ATPase-like phosphatase n=1 Tax=Candidatus Methanofastidiosum methylothiophilum TaxID=1705564 RepID=A0A150JDT7_9EURY|nr:MAG: Soluble P-type ATPase-like phosphatase [Candidatus Methanofastidiosum methylthiophilus]MBP6931911.1 HAD family hydrolase [Methanofastidiosum sp.]OQC52138.1 MAG: Soluble P-type ATPase-like phosphatase [Euryarchaeota archaeon ADurb.Bin023]KYC57165.1 MAG: Soluble P-type ATPase-like phosphatase [Candidatus Methanofastidiosum methylthiophilus]KYC57921.1 MAG: Soluble P-type ATPase-like phosphatase [Candidatus Methanofastidiosum methylthiophilus]